MIARRAEVLESLAERTPRGRALPADVSDAAQLASAIEGFAADGGIDLLIANAGVAHYGPFATQSFELIEQMVATNVLGVLRTVHLALPGMIARGHGHIAVVASGAALRAFPYAAAYGGTKAAELGFATALRHELAGTGISLTAVLPGEVKTALHVHDGELMPDWYDSEGAIPPRTVAEALIAGVEADKRQVSVPGKVRLLGLNGLAPALVDRIMTKLRGPSAAPGLRQRGKN